MGRMEYIVFYFFCPTEIVHFQNSHLLEKWLYFAIHSLFSDYKNNSSRVK